MRFVRQAAWLAVAAFGVGAVSASSADPWVVYDGFDGPGKGKHIVLVSGDEEYRSEETLPQLGKILAKHHGFKCTVLFAIDADGAIDPNINNNIPGLEALKTADLMVIATRFRDLPDEQMKHIAEYVESGKPVIGMRTATHAFNNGRSKVFGKYNWTDKEKWNGGFGRQVLGETWINHHGAHGSQSTLGIVAEAATDHPVLCGIKSGDVWGPTDVYGVTLPLPGDCQPLILGQVLSGMKPTDPPVTDKKNDPMMPVAWVKTFKSGDKTARIFTTTMGASQDLQSAGLRRLLVNAAYWTMGLEDKITPTLNVEIVGDYKPLPFKFNGAAKGVKPADHVLQ